MKTINFIHQLTFEDLPNEVIDYAKRCMLDLTAVTAAGSQTPVAKIVADYVAEEMAGDYPILFSNKTGSRTGAAFANGTAIDSFDAHDGQVLCKGHIGAGVYPAILAFLGQPETLETADINSNIAQEMIINTVIGYELGSRLGIALHRTAKDYHTSGAWNSIAAAAIGARILNLDNEKTRHALGIAEYHGPRSQMMRCIEFPTMIKDGSGIGAMTGVSAALLAEKGYTGAPAITIESDEIADLFSDLGQRWYILEQYFKYYPVCRWAQPAIEAVKSLKKQQDININTIKSIEIHTFHEAKCLGKNLPKNTEEAQYGLAFPFACILLYGKISVDQIINHYDDPEAIKIISKIKLFERKKYNKVFPEQRWADVIIHFQDGSNIQSEPTRTKGDFDNPYSHEKMKTKARQLLSQQMPESEAEKVIKLFWALG